MTPKGVVDTPSDLFPGSSNGRTPDFDSENRGSIPWPGTKFLKGCMVNKQEAEWCDRQVLVMTDLRKELKRVLKLSQKVPNMMLLGSGASTDGVSRSIGNAVEQLNVMIKDSSARAKLYKKVDRR